MRAGLTLLLVAAALVSKCYADAPTAEPNDIICAAEAVAYGEETFFDNVGASREIGLPVENGGPYATVWFTWTAPTSACLDIIIEDALNQYGERLDTYIKLYKLTTSSVLGCPSDSDPSGSDLQASLEVVAENDDTPCYAEYVSLSAFYGVEVTEGSTYYLAVGGWGSETNQGTGTFTVSESTTACATPPECLDDDGDGVNNVFDQCPNTDSNSEPGPSLLHVKGCPTGLLVENDFDWETGCNLEDQLLACASDVASSKGKKGCVNDVVKRWIDEGIVTQRDAGRIKSAAAACL